MLNANAASVNRERDPENRYLWRMNPVRMDAQTSFTSAEVIARRLDQPTDKAFIRTAFQSLLATTPGAEELQTCLEGRKELGPRNQARPAFIHTLLNHHDFITVR